MMYHDKSGNPAVHVHIMYCASSVKTCRIANSAFYFVEFKAAVVNSVSRIGSQPTVCMYVHMNVCLNVCMQCAS
jgi:hypothetical protein